MTIGDVMAALAALAALAVGWGATLLLAALTFPERTRRAGEALAARPGQCLLRGLGVFLTVGIVALALGHQRAGPVRLLGGALWACLALAAALGGAGMVRVLGERIQQIGTPLPPFGSLTRAAALCVAAGFLPVVGWFLVTPLAACLALGGAVLPPRAHPRPGASADALPRPKEGLPGGAV